MAISLNHTIVAARDKEQTARFLTTLFGLPPHRHFAHFAVVTVGETSLDFVETSKPIQPRHFAFLVGDAEFDRIFVGIRERGLTYWADPGRHETNRINTHDGGRGLYFEDPNGHFLEILTRPYGSGDTGA